MLSCSRTSKDRLLGYFLKRHVNLLTPPRPRLPLGTTFIVRGSDITDAPLSSILEGTAEIVERPDAKDVIKDFRDVVSCRHDTKVGAGIAGALLQAVGISSDEDEISAALGEAGVDQVTIALQDLTIARLDRDLLEKSLRKCRLHRDHSKADGRHTYYVATGTWAARTLDLRMKKKGGGNVELEGGVVDLLSGSGKLGLSKGLAAETLISSPTPLVFGVEVMRIGRDGEGLVLLNRRPDARLRGDDEPVDELCELSSETSFTSGPEPAPTDDGHAAA